MYLILIYHAKDHLLIFIIVYYSNFFKLNLNIFEVETHLRIEVLSIKPNHFEKVL